MSHKLRLIFCGFQITQQLPPRKYANREMLFQVTANKLQRSLVYLFLQMLYMFQAVPPPINGRTQLYKQLKVLSTNNAAS